jgi:hypothetical protein
MSPQQSIAHTALPASIEASLVVPYALALTAGQGAAQSDLPP